MTRTFAPAAVFAVIALMALCQCTKSGGDNGSDVTVTLTPAASAALAGAGKGIIVDGFYYGAPVPATQAKTDEAGRITLGEDQVAATGRSAKLRLPGTGLDTVLVDKAVIRDARPMIQVTVYSETTAANLLACSTFDGTVADAHKTGVAIACDVKK